MNKGIWFLLGLFAGLYIGTHPALAGESIPKDAWKLVYADSEEMNWANESGPTYFSGEKAFDNNLDTMWHTEWMNSDPPPPHEIQIDLGAVYEIDGIVHYPRPDGGNGRIKDYEFYVSTNGVDWGEPAIRAFFPDSVSSHEVLFPAKSGQFVRLVALSEMNGNHWTSLAELDIKGVLIDTKLGEFGVAEFEPAGYIKAREGELYVALIESTYSINKKRTQATATVRVHDYMHKPVEGAKVIVEWSTRNGKTNYCTTKADGECTLRNKTPTTRKPEPILLKVIVVDHPTLSYFSEEGWGAIWIVCPDELTCE